MNRHKKSTNSILNILLEKACKLSLNRANSQSNYLIDQNYHIFMVGRFQFGFLSLLFISEQFVSNIIIDIMNCHIKHSANILFR